MILESTYFTFKSWNISHSWLWSVGVGGDLKMSGIPDYIYLSTMFTYFSFSSFLNLCILSILYNAQNYRIIYSMQLHIHAL